MRLFLLTALTMTAFAANSILNRAAVGRELIGAVDFAVVRLIAGAGALALLIAIRWVRSGQAVWPGRSGRLAGASALLVYLFGFSLAYGALDAGTGALILFGMVQITMFAGALLARESVPARRWVGAGLAFAGLVYLLAPGAGAAHPLSAGLMAAAGAGWGIYSLSARGTRDPLGATGWNFLLAVPAAAVLLASVPAAAAVPLRPAGLSLAIVSGAVTSGLGYALWYAILPKLGAARAAVAQLTVPVIAAFGGLFLIGEAVTLRLVVAGMLVLCGVALATVPRRSAAAVRAA